jgi:CelD/BcsL family acetyltransferase involved in cellulose biosynthesis
MGMRARCLQRLPALMLRDQAKQMLNAALRIAECDWSQLSMKRRRAQRRRIQRLGAAGAHNLVAACKPDDLP